MANNYFDNSLTAKRFVMGETARGIDVDSKFDQVESAFDTFPDPAIGKKGFSSNVAVGDPINPEDAINLQFLNTQSDSAINAVLAAHEETKTLAIQQKQSEERVVAIELQMQEYIAEADASTQAVFNTLSGSLETFIEPQLAFLGHMVWQNAANAARIKITGVN